MKIKVSSTQCFWFFVLDLFVVLEEFSPYPILDSVTLILVNH